MLRLPKASHATSPSRPTCLQSKRTLSPTDTEAKFRYLTRQWWAEYAWKQRTRLAGQRYRQDMCCVQADVMRVQHIAVICAGLLLAGVATGQTPTNQQTYCAGAQGNFFLSAGSNRKAAWVLDVSVKAFLANVLSAATPAGHNKFIVWIVQTMLNILSAHVWGKLLYRCTPQVYASALS